MKIARRTIEEQPSDSAQHGITDPAMFPWHGPRLDAPLKPIAHHQVIAFTQLLDKSRRVAKVVTGIGIAHQNEFTASRLNPAHQSISIPLLGNLDNPSAQSSSNRLRAVGAPVIRNNNLPINPRLSQSRLSFNDTKLQSLRFVQAG